MSPCLCFVLCLSLPPEPLAKIGGILPQREPVEKNLRILEPNREPLADFFGQPAVVFICSYTGDDQFELALQTQDGGTQALVIGSRREFFHPGDGNGDVVELQLFRCKQTRRAPTHVVFEDVRMDQHSATIGKRSGDRCRTGVRFHFFIYHGSF